VTGSQTRGYGSTPHDCVMANLVWRPHASDLVDEGMRPGSSKRRAARDLIVAPVSRYCSLARWDPDRAASANTHTVSRQASVSVRVVEASDEFRSSSTTARESQPIASCVCCTTVGGSSFTRADSSSGAAVL
jgi:hypothetical protein